MVSQQTARSSRLRVSVRTIAQSGSKSGWRDVAALAPMPIASVRTVTEAKPGFLRMLLSAQRITVKRPNAQRTNLSVRLGYRNRDGATTFAMGFAKRKAAIPGSTGG